MTDPALRAFSPVVREWFVENFSTPTDPQARGWPAIASKRDTLIAAPTGSGKTLAAFLHTIDRLISSGPSLPDKVDVVYVSPLKALSNDIHRNLELPLAQLRERSERAGESFPEVRVAVRTGDTPASERVKMLKRPPHILVTTPESLYILLTSERSRGILDSVRTVIVDEIHAVAGDKRGAHLALTLERLDRLVRSKTSIAPQRIGLSATQSPIEKIARLLVGTHREPPHLVDGGHARDLDLAIEVGDEELGAIASNDQLGRVYDRIAELILEHETTIVFVNTRRLVERVSHALEQRLGEESVVAHHGSLSRRIRFAAEQKLKSGHVRCAVATASLELGIDVGSVDLVVQLGSPRCIATLLQRIGRSGHSLGKTPKGRLFALTRDQLVESAALVRAIRKGRLDKIRVPENPRDIAAQQIVATVACEEIAEDELYNLICGAAPFSGFSREDFDSLVEILSEGISTRRGRSSSHLHRDRIAGVLRARKGARLAAITCGGAIPDNFNYPVVTFPEETPVGSLDEDFAIESSPGDIFLLGNTSWRVRRVEADRVLVEDAAGLPPTIPFWLGEAPARTAELSEEVCSIRREADERLSAGTNAQDLGSWLAEECALAGDGGIQLARYLEAARVALGALPSDKCIVAERFFDDGGGMQLVLHSPFGGRINKAWGLALRKRFCRSFNFELQAAATDDGIIISLGPPHSFPLPEVFEFLRSNSAERVLSQAVLAAPVFGVRWRWSATRSLALLRRYGGKRVAPHLLRMRSEDLLAVVFPMQQACLENVVGDIEVPDHPLVVETMNDCLRDFMDIDGLVDLLRDIEDGEISVVARDTTEPSPLAHEIVSANPYAFLDDVPLEERRTRAVSLPRGLRPADEHLVDEGAVARAVEEASPRLDSPDEVHDHLLTTYLCAMSPQLQGALEQLREQGRAVIVQIDELRCWAAAERVPRIAEACPNALFEPDPRPLPFAAPPLGAEAASAAILRGQLEYGPPVCQAVLRSQTGLSDELLRAGLGLLEADGAVLRGRWTQGASEDQWAERRMLARIHRHTVGRLRRAVEPVAPAALMRFLFRWQRLAPGCQLFGREGLATVITQLQGFEAAAGSWESELLGSRIDGYQSQWLDDMTMSGQLAWARLSPKGGDEASLSPTKAAPISLTLRHDLSWLRSASPSAANHRAAPAGDAQTVYEILVERGALFLSEIAAHSSLEHGLLEEALWQLANEGLATSDGFACLRVLIERQRGVPRSHFDLQTLGSGSNRWRRAVHTARRKDRSRPEHSLRSLPSAGGRWSVLAPTSADDSDPESSARQLLARYGVVFRELMGRESCLPPWRDLLRVFRRMENRGEIRGGRFVGGFVGEQFALPEALRGLREARATGSREQIVRLSASDPLNLVGITSPGPRVPSVRGNAVLYRDGVPIASVVAGKLQMLSSLSEGTRVEPDLAYHRPPAAQADQADLPFA